MACARSAAALLAFGVLVSACAQPHEPPHDEHAEVHWGYEGEGAPEHWGSLSPDYAMCAEGRAQSPIDLVDTIEAPLDRLDPRYDGHFIEAVNLGHTLQLTVAPGSMLQVGDRRYDLLQMHFHVPSEHVIAGERFPLEAHFVHRDDAGALLVVGEPYREGEANEALAAVIAVLPADIGARRAVDLGAQAIGPQAGEPYYHYDGSLTTPPCSEGVSWHVLQTPRTVSRDQLAAIRAVLTTSARPLQERGDRLVRAPVRE